MPAVYTSFFNNRPAIPLPEFIWTDFLLYRFAADAEVYSDESLTLAEDGDPVYTWGNLGISEDAIQPSLERRPIFREGGIGDKPHLECNYISQQYFNDLNLSFPSGLISGRLITVFAVVKVNNHSVGPSLMGSTVANGGKAMFRFTANENASIVFNKNQVVGGIVTTNPQLIMCQIISIKIVFFMPFRHVLFAFG